LFSFPDADKTFISDDTESDDTEPSVGKDETLAHPERQCPDKSEDDMMSSKIK